MKRKQFLKTLFGTPILLSSSLKDIEEYNEYNKIIGKGKILNGKKHGYWEYYYSSNSIIKSKGNYLNGLKDGEWEEFLYSGTLNAKGKYKNGKKDGKWVAYNLVINDISQIVNYKNGIFILLEVKYQEYKTEDEAMLVIEEYKKFEGKKIIATSYKFIG